MQTLQKICLGLTIVGAINWGLVGLFNFNLVEAIFGVDALLTKVIYSFVGLAGIINIGYYLLHLKKMQNKNTSLMCFFCIFIRDNLLLAPSGSEKHLLFHTFKCNNNIPFLTIKVKHGFSILLYAIL